MIIKLDDWQFDRYEHIDKAAIEESYLQLLEQKEITNKLEKTMFAEYNYQLIKELIEENYDLGTVVEVFKMYGGEINLSYGFVVEKDGTKEQYFLRKYNRFAGENRIRFEHDFLTFLREQGMDEVAAIIKTQDGETFVKNDEMDKSYFYAVYSFLEGKDLYRWWDDFVPVDGCYKIGKECARFHYNSAKYDTSRFASEEPGVYYVIKDFIPKFREYAAGDYSGIYHDTFTGNIDEIVQWIEDIHKELTPEEVEALPKVTVNGDLHQGNMKYDEDHNVVGLFDFDWVKTDTRLFEVAGVVHYLVLSWQANDDGEINWEKVDAFMKGYQETLRELGGFPPMNEAEAKAFPYFMEMVCIYNVINWSADDHYQLYGDINIYMYDYYLKHAIRACRRAKELGKELEAAVLKY